MTPPPIAWRHLVDHGESRARGGSSHRNVTAKVAKLDLAPGPSGVQAVPDTPVAADATCRVTPTGVNRIRVGAEPNKEWPAPRTDISLRREVCGDLRCRALDMDGQTREAFPGDLTVKAATIQRGPSSSIR